MGDFMNKVVLVTGSSKGLGKSIILEFAKNNYDVVINYNKSKKEALDLENKVKELYGVKVLTIKSDISKEDEVIEMKNAILKEFKHIDVLVNNAAVEISSNLEEKNYETFKEVFDVNVFGAFLVTKHIGREMFNNKSGSIINISSNNAINKYSIETMEYDSSKAALINMSNNFALAYAPYVRVNTITPGWIKTERIEKLDKELDNLFIEEESKKILLNRFADPKEIAKVVLFLASSDSSYINQSVIQVDGGNKNG